MEIFMYSLVHRLFQYYVPQLVRVVNKHMFRAMHVGLSTVVGFRIHAINTPTYLHYSLATAISRGCSLGCPSIYEPLSVLFPTAFSQRIYMALCQLSAA